MRIVIALIWLVIVSITFGQAPIQRQTFTTNVVPGTARYLTNGTLSTFRDGITLPIGLGTNHQCHLTNGSFVGFGIEHETTTVTNCRGEVLDGGAIALAHFKDDANGLPSFDCLASARGGTILSLAVDGCTNISFTGSEGGFASGFFEVSTNFSVQTTAGAWTGGYAFGSDNLQSVVNDGGIVTYQLVLSSGSTLRAQDGAAALSDIVSCTNVDTLVDGGSLGLLKANLSTNVALFSNEGSIVATYFNLATNVAGVNVANAQNGSMAVGVVNGSERLWAQGSPTGVGAMAIGRDVAATNAWGIGIHDTNAIPFSFRVGYGNIRAMQVESNLNTTVHALKVGLVNQGTLTNILFGSATLNFASTSSGAIEDLAITVTGAADGDIVSVGVPQTAATGIIGSWMGFASNNTVFVRFIPTAATQNPNSGTFKVMVHKFQ